MRHEREIPGPLDGADDLGLLLAVGACAPRSFDLAGGCHELGQDVQPLVVDVFLLQLGDSLAAIA